MVSKGQEDLINLSNRNIQSLDPSQKMLVLLAQSIQCMKEVEPREVKKKEQSKELPPPVDEEHQPADKGNEHHKGKNAPKGGKQ